MAEKEALSAANGQSGHMAPPAESQNALQERRHSTSLDFNRDAVVQPFPRSPKLLKKLANAAQPTQEQLSRRMGELQAEATKTEAHIKSLKKRKADLSRNTDVMKQQVRERFESMVRVLQQDQQAVLDSLELDLRQTKSRLDQVLRDWGKHQERLERDLCRVQRALSEGATADDEGHKAQWENMSPKKPEKYEKEIQLNKDRFERLLKTLSSISKELKAQLQRKTLLLDSSSMVIDRQTCHSQINVTSEGRGLSFSAIPSGAVSPEHPLQFDRVFCALACCPVPAPLSYWEVDVGCCPSWAVGVAYARLERKGRDKGSKLGRNRNSWCVELRGGRLSAWHNGRSAACHVAGTTQTPGRVGVWVDYDKGQLVFYDADTMAVLQNFSAAMTTVFDRAHHQFTEPLYAALRFLKPPENSVDNHMELCQLI